MDKANLPASRGIENQINSFIFNAGTLSSQYNLESLITSRNKYFKIKQQKLFSNPPKTSQGRLTAKGGKSQSLHQLPKQAPETYLEDQNNRQSVSNMLLSKQLLKQSSLSSFNVSNEKQSLSNPNSVNKTSSRG